MNEARYRHKAIVYNKKLFVFGGCGRDGVLNSIEMCSPFTNQFVTMAPMKSARTDFGCCVVGNLVYVIGGLIDASDQFDEDDLFHPTNTMEIYNLDTNTWNCRVYLPFATDGLHACAVDDKL